MHTTFPIHPRLTSHSRAAKRTIPSNLNNSTCSLQIKNPQNEVQVPVGKLHLHETRNPSHRRVGNKFPGRRPQQRGPPPSLTTSCLCWEKRPKIPTHRPRHTRPARRICIQESLSTSNNQQIRRPVFPFPCAPSSPHRMRGSLVWFWPASCSPSNAVSGKRTRGGALGRISLCIDLCELFLVRTYIPP